MTYIPHAALSGVRFITGSIESVQFITNRNSTIKYQIYCNVTAYGVAGNKRLSNIRYFGTTSVYADGQTRISPPGYFDKVIEWAVENGETVESITTDIRTKLLGSIVTAQNLGGSWIIR